MGNIKKSRHDIQLTAALTLLNPSIGKPRKQNHKRPNPSTGQGPTISQSESCAQQAQIDIDSIPYQILGDRLATRGRSGATRKYTKTASTPCRTARFSGVEGGWKHALSEYAAIHGQIGGLVCQNDRAGWGNSIDRAVPNGCVITGLKQGKASRDELNRGCSRDN